MPTANPSPTLAGSLRIFQVAGISVFVHWSWLVVAVIELQTRRESYGSWIWNVAEYLSLFVIVLLHEFGHAFACRQVDGEANEIVLWPLGGIAFVNPPPRPGAVLWSIAAGPLVNLILVPITIGACVAFRMGELHVAYPDADQYLLAVMGINLGLFIFNILPVYPLDGGQMLQALLWFVIGRAKSLTIVCVLGLIACVAGIALSLLVFQSLWLTIVAGFAALRCWNGFQQAKVLAQLEQVPRRRNAACPSCGAHPFLGACWQCDRCRTTFDMFAEQAQCPECGKQFGATTCMECGRQHPIWAWYDEQGQPMRADADEY